MTQSSPWRGMAGMNNPFPQQFAVRSDSQLNQVPFSVPYRACIEDILSNPTHFVPDAVSSQKLTSATGLNCSSTRERHGEAMSERDAVAEPAAVKKMGKQRAAARRGGGWGSGRGVPPSRSWRPRARRGRARDDE